MGEPHSLDGTPFDPEDFAAAQMPEPEPDPCDEGVVFVNWVSLEEDLWVASWERGTEHEAPSGTRAEIVRWALARRAGRRRIYDASVGDYVPLV